MVPELLLAEALHMPVDSIPPDAAFGRLPQWDSVAHLRLLLLLEEKRGVEISEALMNEVVSLSALRDLCASLAVSQCDPAWEQIYASQKELNKYPHHYLVSYAFRNFPTPEARQNCCVLEVGCGAGNNLAFLAREGFSASGIDGAPSAIATAQTALSAAGLAADLVVGDFTSLPWQNETFDLVVDRNSLTHVSEYALENALNEIFRVLQPGGKFFSMIYSDRHPALAHAENIDGHAYADFRGGYFAGHGLVGAYNEMQIQKLFGNRFEIISLRLMEETDYMPDQKPANAIWIIDARKPA